MNSKDDINDFDQDTDLDDIWEDEGLEEDVTALEDPEALEDPLMEDTSEDNLPLTAKKKKGVLGPLLFIILLGGGGYAALPYVMPLISPESGNKIPVISLTDDTLPAISDPSELPDQGVADFLPQEDEPTPAPFEQPLENNESNGFLDVPDTSLTDDSSVLTPMPENIDELSVPLPALNAQESQEQPQQESDLGSDETALAQKEQELIGKTEMAFDAPEETVTTFLPEEQAPIAEEDPEPAAAQESQAAADQLPFESAPDFEEIADDVPSKNNPFETNQPVQEAEAQKIEETPSPVVTESTAIADEPIITEKEEDTSLIEQIIDEEPLVIPTQKPETAPVTPQKTIATPETKKVVKKEWVIRGAQPGAAIIYDEISKEILSIEPGDTVKGLGRIQSIKKVDGRWVIDGTEKQVSR